MNDLTTNNNYKFKKVAPEGKWGYLVAIGLSCSFALAAGSLHSFGLIFNDFLTNLGAETSAVTTITGVFYGAHSFTALFAGTLFKRFSMRSVGVLGASLYFIGSVLTMFVNSVEMLVISFGVFQGCGMGLMVPVGYTSFNHYFVKRRVFMMSVTQALKGLVITLHPIVTNILMNMYGFRGTLAIIAAINAHAIFGMLAMHPIKWHYKVIKVHEIELKPLMKTPDKKDENDVNVDMKLDEDHNGIDEPSDVQINSARNQLTWVGNGIKHDYELITKKFERSKSLADPTHLAEFDPIRNRIASIMCLSDFGGDIGLRKSTETIKIGCWQKVVEFLDLTLMKDVIYVNIVLGMSFALLADHMFFPLLPMYLNTLGFTKSEAAGIVSIGAGADLISRVVLAVFCLFIQPKARYIFLAGSITTIIVRFVLVNVSDYVGMMVTVGAMGFFHTCLQVPVSLIFAEHLPSKRFASGYGLYIFLQGNLIFLIGPILGWIRDFTQSYIIFFHILSFITSLCVFPWLIEFVWLKMYPKKNEI